jgi:CRP-like cAMP-binding protein
MDLLGFVRNADNIEAFPAGSTIFEAGSPGSVMYIVVEGEVDVFAGDVLVETVGPGNAIGEMALIDTRTRSATARARTDCRLAPVDEKRFLFMVQQTPFFALHIMRLLASRLRHMNAEIGG